MESNITDETESMIEISLTERKVVVRGSEKFVEKNIVDMIKYIKDCDFGPKNSYQFPTVNAEQNESLAVTRTIRDINRDKYLNAGIYSIDNGIVRLHKKIPGKTKTDKMRNIGVIAAYAKGDKIDSQDVNNLCKSQGCLDEGNFSSVFKKSIENIIINKTSEKKWEIELTINGKLLAETLLDEICEPLASSF